MISRCLIEILICCLYNLCYTINYNVQHGNDMEGTSTVSLHTERISPEMLNGYQLEYAYRGTRICCSFLQRARYYYAIAVSDQIMAFPVSSCKCSLILQRTLYIEVSDNKSERENFITIK